VNCHVLHAHRQYHAVSSLTCLTLYTSDDVSGFTVNVATVFIGEKPQRSTALAIDHVLAMWDASTFPYLGLEIAPYTGVWRGVEFSQRRLTDRRTVAT
jgi:hypothetical protein